MQVQSDTFGFVSTEFLRAVAKQLDSQACGSGIATGSANADGLMSVFDSSGCSCMPADAYTAAVVSETQGCRS